MLTPLGSKDPLVALARVVAVAECAAMTKPKGVPLEVVGVLDGELADRL